MNRFTLEELAKHHEATGSKVSEYVAASDYDAIKAERDALAAQVKALRSQLNEEDKYCEQAIDQRDHYHECADDLANAIARFFGVDIGEHTSANNPWREALDSIPIESLAEIRAEAGRAGYLQGHLDAGGDYGKLHKKLSEHYAEKYAKKIRQGGAK